MSEIMHAADASTSDPAPTFVRRLLLKAVIGFGVFATAAWTSLLGYGFLKLIGLP